MLLALVQLDKNLMTQPLAALVLDVPVNDTVIRGGEGNNKLLLCGALTMSHDPQATLLLQLLIARTFATFAGVYMRIKTAYSFFFFLLFNEQNKAPFTAVPVNSAANSKCSNNIAELLTA